MPRSNYLIVSAGTQRCGKSTFARKITDHYSSDKRVLVIDPDGEERIWHQGFRHIDISTLGKVKKGEKVRMVYDIENKEYISTIRDTFRNGIIIFDDARVYLRNMLEFESFIIRRRQYNVDMIFTFHGLSAVPPLIWTYASHLALWQTTDSFDRSKQKIPNFDFLASCVGDVNKQATRNRYAFKIYKLK